jgi:DNA-binding transcriptional MerR regulator
MSQAAAVTKKILRRRDVMDLLGISEREYRTYIEIGLLVPITSGGKRHSFSFVQIVQKFDLNPKPAK